MDVSTQKPSIATTILLVASIVPFMILLMSLYNIIGVGMSYFGFLFLLYWAAIMHQSPAEFWPSVLGGLVGIAMGWLLIAAPSVIGPAGQYVGLPVLAVVLFFYMRRQVHIVVNNATMLFMIAATIPDLKVEENVITMAGALVISAGYMGALSLLMRQIGKWRAERGKNASMAADSGNT